MEHDINKFEHSGQVTEGCSTGTHIWDEGEGHSTVEKDGDLTKIKLRCLACGKQFDISAPLGLNDFIGRQQNNIDRTVYDTSTQQRNEVSNNEENSDILKRLLG